MFSAILLLTVGTYFLKYEEHTSVSSKIFACCISSFFYVTAGFMVWIACTEALVESEEYQIAESAHSTQTAVARQTPIAAFQTAEAKKTALPATLTAVSK